MAWNGCIIGNPSEAGYPDGIIIKQILSYLPFCWVNIPKTDECNILSMETANKKLLLHDTTTQ